MFLLRDWFPHDTFSVLYTSSYMICTDILYVALIWTFIWRCTELNFNYAFTLVLILAGSLEVLMYTISSIFKELGLALREKN